VAEQLEEPLPTFTVWDPALPDCRLADPKKQGLLPSRAHGPLTRIYCIACHRPAPIAAWGDVVKMIYKCTACVQGSGAPPHTIGVVPGTEAF
jgi:hypothetical protein